MKRIFYAILAAAMLTCSAAIADVIVLKGGDRISGKVIRESETEVTLETQFGNLTIPRSDIERILSDSPQRQEYLKRIARLAEKHRQLARWCEERGLEEQAQEHAEAALEMENILAAYGADPGEKPEVTHLEVFQAVWEAVRDKFYDRETYNGCDWDATREKYLPRAKEAKTRFELYDICNEMLEELHASHCYVWSPYVWKDHVRNEFQGEKSLQAGIEILRLEDKYFVRSVYDGGPADEAGVEVGEELVSVDGVPVTESDRMVVKDGISTGERVLYVLRTDDGAALNLGLRRRAGGIAVEIPVKPAMTSMLEAARNSARIVERGGKKLGYIHLWHFMNRAMTGVFRDAVAGELKDCDGLILDVRGRGGSPRVIRDVLRVFTRGGWVKPSVLVVDRDTSSAKEIFAHYWKQSKLGPVVGHRTAGHVLGSGMVPMPDGSMLLLARVKVTRMTDGVDLEGKGVRPDVIVRDSAKYCGGRHPILEKAFEELLKEVERSPEKPMEKTTQQSRKAA